jgi:hypothetical protein
MSWLQRILGKDGNIANVTPDNELVMATRGVPPFNGRNIIQPISQFLTDDGLSTGSNDMAVDGSSTNVDFWIPAVEGCDRYITTLSVIVGYGASGKPFQWADGNTLINGHRLFYLSAKGELVIDNAIKSNQDLFRLQFGLIPTAWEVRHVNAANDFGYFLDIDLTRFGLPNGIRLQAGTTQKLVVTIRDNAGTDADSFNIIAKGFDRFK